MNIGNTPRGKKFNWNANTKALADKLRPIIERNEKDDKLHLLER